MTRRATARGDARSSLDGTRADVLVCGASFAGLAVAREGWLHAMGAGDAIREVLPDMTFSTPHGTVRYRLPWRWAAFDYRTLCELLFAQCDARFETAKVHGRSGEAVHTDRGDLTAPLIVDALGWRRVLSGVGYQPPAAPLSRGLEVHPPAASKTGARPALDVWVDRSLARRGFAWRVPAGGEERIGVGSYEPRDHVRAPTEDLAARLEAPAERWQGNWFPHRLRPAAEDGVFFCGDSAGHCFPLSGEGIRTAFHFGIAAGRELRAVVAGECGRAEALARYGAFSDGHARAFRRALRLQRLVPALPPRVLTLALRAVSPQPLVDRMFDWYLAQAPPPR
jgi:flavin-dependent dehydrogenase